VNYLEHWGLQRQPGTAITARHAWQSESALMELGLLGLGRHADHHLRGRRPYSALKWHPESPVLPRGLLTMLALVLFRNGRARSLLSAALDRPAPVFSSVGPC